MNEYPKISIVTTNFNQGKYLEDTIKSVLSQNYPNLEYIIIDGGSTDNSVEIIKKYDAKLAYWESAPDKGMYDGLQKGLARTTGEIMAWINSDDMYLPKSFFSVAEIFTKFPKINWLLGFPTIWDMQGRLVECPHAFRQWSKYDFLIGEYKWIQQESVFWRRPLWEKVGGRLNTSLRYAGDFDLWFRFFQQDKLYVSESLLSGFRVREKQLSLVGKEKYDEEIKFILSKYKMNEKERTIVAKYRRLNNIISFISYFKLFNTGAFRVKFKLKYFDYPPFVGFNREEQRFQLYD